MKEETDFKSPDLIVELINKDTKKPIVRGTLVGFKDLPELLISFDNKYFFTVRENPLYEINTCYVTNKAMVPFDYKKYNEYIYKYFGMASRNTTKEYIFEEFTIEELDPEIAPLVYALNNAKYNTTGSCCGHNDTNAWIDIIFINFDSLKKFTKILERSEFKENFILRTHFKTTHTPDDEIRLTLETTHIGECAYKHIQELADYLENN